MKKIFFVALWATMAACLYAQDYNTFSFTDPGAGDGSDGTLHVPPNTTHIMNSVRARVTDIESMGPGMGYWLHYEDLEGIMHEDDLLLLIVNSNTEEDPTLQNHWLLRPR